jgi:hypothetical protein
MAEPRQIAFSYTEIAELMVKQQNIHEGLWSIFLEFGIGAAHTSTTPHGTAVPTAIVPVQQMGLIRADEEIPGITVDAAVVNPEAKSE